jgi:hypothetical protein
MIKKTKFVQVLQKKKRKLALPFMSSRALLASSSEANFTKPNPFDRLVILSVTMVAELEQERVAA